MRLPHITKNVTFDIVQDMSFHGPTRVIARCDFQGQRFAECFTVYPEAPEHYARHCLDRLALQIGRHIVFAEAAR